MIDREDLCTFLNSIYQPTLFEDFCTNGLQVEGKKTINRIAVAVTASHAVIQKAIEWRADALLVHHGLFWKGTELCSLTGLLYRRVKLLFENEISLFAYHLPMDGHMSLGNCWGAAIDLGLKDLQPLALFAKERTPIAVKGSWSDARPLDQVVKQLSDYYGQMPRVASRQSSVPISKVGICSGGAHRYFEAVLCSDIDLFITGTGDEPQWHVARELNKAFVAVGHFASERIGPKKITQVLSKELSVDVCFLDEENPF